LIGRRGEKITGTRTWALPLPAAEEHIARFRGALDQAGPEICPMYAHAEICLARKTPAPTRAPRYRRAKDAVDAGLAQATSEGSRRSLKAVQLLLDDLLAGRHPTLQILYLAGLGELAAMSQPKANVVDVLTMRVRQDRTRGRRRPRSSAHRRRRRMGHRDTAR
jgi:hypothetical protein